MLSALFSVMNKKKEWKFKKKNENKIYRKCSSLCFNETVWAENDMIEMFTANNKDKSHKDPIGWTLWRCNNKHPQLWEQFAATLSLNV